MPPLRQAFDAGGTHFSFAKSVGGRRYGPDDREGGAEYGSWTRRVRGSHDYFGRSSNLRFGAQNYRDFGVWNSRELEGLTQPEDDRLGDTSPPLWEKPVSPRVVPMHPGSRAEAIANYRQEMMEMVRGVPESAYELSLRDLVEVRTMAKPKEEGIEEERGVSEVVTGWDKKDQKKPSNGKKHILRTTSMDRGVILLKMFFPASLGWRRKSASSGSGSKVSPKPVVSDGEKSRPDKSVDAEGSDSETSGSSRIHRSGQRWKTTGCFPISFGKTRIQ